MGVATNRDVVLRLKARSRISDPALYLCGNILLMAEEWLTMAEAVELRSHHP